MRRCAILDVTVWRCRSGCNLARTSRPFCHSERGFLFVRRCRCWQSCRWDGLTASLPVTAFAFVSVRRTRVQQLLGEGERRATQVLGQLNHLNSYTAETQLGMAMVVLALGWIGKLAVATSIDPPIRSMQFIPEGSWHLPLLNERAWGACGGSTVSRRRFASGCASGTGDRGCCRPVASVARGRIGSRDRRR